MDQREIIIFIAAYMIGVFVGYFLLKKRPSGILVMDDSNPLGPKWLVKFYRDPYELVEKGQITLIFGKKINEGEQEWQNEK